MAIATVEVLSTIKEDLGLHGVNGHLRGVLASYEGLLVLYLLLHRVGAMSDGTAR